MTNRLEMYQEELSYIIDIIENYFPKNLEYSSDEYKNSKQFLLYKELREKNKRDKEYIKAIEYKLKISFIL